MADSPTVPSAFPNWPMAAIAGIGTDLLDRSRIERMPSRRIHSLAKRILSDKEMSEWTLLESEQQKITRVAKQFSAKEALSKALGTGFSQGIQFTDIEVLRDELGAPVVYLHGHAALRARHLGASGAWVSLSDDGVWIQAFAVVGERASNV